MDGSDREIKDDCTGEKSKTGEKHNEPETDKICQDKESMHYTPVNSSVKRKSEQCSKNQRKRSTDNVRKQPDDHLLGCADMQDTVLPVSISKKYEKQLNAETFPCSKTKSMEEHSDQADQSNTEEKIDYSEKSHSAIKEIKESMITYFSDVIDQSETDRLHLETIIDEINNGVIKILKRIKEIVLSNRNVSSDKPTSENILDSKRLKISISSEDHTKIVDENSLEKEQLEEGTSTLILIESMCPTCKQDGFLTPILSPGKRKSEDNDEERKRKRSADIALIKRNDESLADILKAQDSAVYAGHSNKREKHLINTTISIDTVEELVKKQDKDINWTDKPPIQYKITETKDEICYDTHELETSNKTITSDQTQNCDKVLLLEDSTGSFTRNISIKESFLSASSDDLKSSINLQNEINNESTSVNRLEDSKNKDIATENLSNFQDFPDMSVPDLPTKAENKFVKSSNKMSNTDTKVSCDIPLQMGENSSNTNKSEDTNISKKREDELSEESLTGQGIISISVIINSNEEDSMIINLEHLEKDTEFIENQKQILESISLQRQKPSSIKHESDDEGRIRKPLIGSCSNEVYRKIPTEVALRFARLIQILIKNLETQSIDDVAESTLIERLMNLVIMYDPDCIPYIPHFIYKLCETETAKKISLARSIEEFLEESTSMEEPTEILHDILNPTFPNSSPPKNESDKITERDSNEFREYPGLAEDLTSVKKDARYQKKFYKRNNPVMLPRNWRGDKTSCEIQPNIDSEENKIKTTDDMGIVTRNSGDGVHDDKSREDQKNILKNKDLLREKEKSEDMLSPEEQTKVKDKKHQKTFYKCNLAPLPINWSEDGDSSSEIKPNIDSDKNVTQRIEDDQRYTSRNSDDSVHVESKYPKVLSKDKNMFEGKEKSPGEKLWRASDNTLEYRISSFMEESSNCSQSNSPKNEFKLPSVLGTNPQPEELSTRSMSTASEISISLAAPPESPGSLPEPPHTNALNKHNFIS